MNGDELFTKMVNLGELCVDELMRSSLSSNRGVYNIGEFEVMSVSPLVGKNKPILEFWKKGKRDQKFVRVADQFLIIFEEKGKVILSDLTELNVNKFIGRYPSFPLFEFTWTGRPTKGMPMGTLKFARVDLNGSDFVSYYYDSASEKYTLYNPQKRNLREIEIPVGLEEADEIMGVPLEKVIDFDREMSKIIGSLELEEFHQALLNRA